ncbi:putative serine/threonine protein kinase [Blyttiomyces sp. JEL0837]|nr:putative serine/threonine protein kinase [Blyttiomyces sp. JEL0837]
MVAATASFISLLALTSQVMAIPMPGGPSTTPTIPPPPPVNSSSLQQVLFVGNNWEGTVSVIQSTYPYTSLGKVNAVPDKDARIAEIQNDPIKSIFYNQIRSSVGEGHDQYVDDIYSTPDGTALVASRPSFADVVSINLANGAINWRFPVAGYRSDHMALSPDGLKVAVSASIANTVHILDIYTGVQLGNFKAGDRPHENFWTNDGTLIWNAAIGFVETNQDAPWQDFTKGDRRFTIANATTFEVIKTINIRPLLDNLGLKNFSNAIRPAVFLPDWSKLYFQVSFFNGFFEYDVASNAFTRYATLPENPNLTTDRTQWLLDSRHHGISMNPSSTKLCVAGTMDNYTTIVDRETFAHGPLIDAVKPYWATVSGDGKHCIISESGANQTTAIDFETGNKVGSMKVGYHPQRVRIGHVKDGWVSLL